MNTAELSSMSKQVRRDIINMTANAGSGHPGGSLSAADLMTCLFFNHMHVDPKRPDDPDRDRFVLSKGHAAPCYYAVLAEMGFISRDEFKNFRQLHSTRGTPTARRFPASTRPPAPWARAVPSPWVWRWAPSSSTRIAGSMPCWATASARRARSGSPSWRLPTISWTI